MDDTSQPADTAEITTDQPRSLNISVIYDGADGGFLTSALAQITTASCALVVSNAGGFLPDLQGQARMDFTQAGLDNVPIKLADVSRQLKDAANGHTAGCVIVDMRWGAGTVAAAANFERWGGLCDRFVEETQVSVISVYERSLMIEDQLMAAVRGHSHFLAPSGLYENPFWLPPAYQNGATISQQIGFVLARIVPDYEGVVDHDDGEASGANPQWITVPRRPPLALAETDDGPYWAVLLWFQRCLCTRTGLLTHVDF
jgi:hypothetical protein